MLGIHWWPQKVSYVELYVLLVASFNKQLDKPSSCRWRHHWKCCSSSQTFKIWFISGYVLRKLHSCQSQSAVPQITLSCYKALSQQKYKVWSHFPLNPHYNTPRHLMIWLKSVRPTYMDFTQGVLEDWENEKFQRYAFPPGKSPPNNMILQYSCNKQWFSKNIQNASKFPGIFMLFLFHDEFFVCQIYDQESKIRISLYFFLFLELDI